MQGWTSWESRWNSRLKFSYVLFLALYSPLCTIPCPILPIWPRRNKPGHKGFQQSWRMEQKEEGHKEPQLLLCLLLQCWRWVSHPLTQQQQCVNSCFWSYQSRNEFSAMTKKIKGDHLTGLRAFIGMVAEVATVSWFFPLSFAHFIFCRVLSALVGPSLGSKTT